MKHALALHIASLVEDGQTIGFGSGRTTEIVLQALGERVLREKISIRGIPTSYRTALVAAENGITVLSAINEIELDWHFDGADQIDPQLRAIKGNGAAMLTEKIIAHRARKLIIVATEEKLAPALGGKQAVPLEVFPQALGIVKGQLNELGATKIELRAATGKYGPIITEHGNFVLDAWFDEIPTGFEQTLKSIVGVAENGLFETQIDEVVVATETELLFLKAPIA